MSDSGAVYVLDSFAVLALLQSEPGAGEVQTVLRRAQRGEAEAYLSVINLGEVIYTVERELGIQEAHRAIAIVQQLPLRIVQATQQRVFAAAHVKAKARISYADAFAVAAAAELGGEIVTGDPEFAAVEGEVPISWLPQG